MIRCLHCGAETSNGLALCELCQRKVATCLEFLPVYFRNLARQRQPGRPNGSLGMTGSWLIRRGEVDGSKVQAALSRVVNDLTTWARSLADDRGIEVPVDAETEAETVAALCDLLDHHLASIATLEWAGQFVRDIDRHEKALGTLTEAVVPGWYAGKCGQVTGRDMEGAVYVCGTPTYVVPGLTWLTCTGCGTTTAARDHLEAVIDEARAWVAPPMRIAETVVALVDTELSVARLHKRIAKWGEERKVKRKRDGEVVVVVIPARVVTVRRLDEDGDPVGAKRYRLGDVLDLLFSEGPTRLREVLPETA